MRITKVYTRTGDFGTTRLASGREVRKDDPRIEAYGTVDELNSVLGVVRTEIGRAGLPPGAGESLDAGIGAIQHDLFGVGTALATPPQDRKGGEQRIGDADVARIEAGIDEMNAGLPALGAFVLPGGTPLAAQIHLARTVCRRAERRAFALEAAQEVDAVILRYLNRLSDWLFVAARVACRLGGVDEPLWLPQG